MSMPEQQHKGPEEEFYLGLVSDIVIAAVGIEIDAHKVELDVWATMVDSIIGRMAKLPAGPRLLHAMEKGIEAMTQKEGLYTFSGCAILAGSLYRASSNPMAWQVGILAGLVEELLENRNCKLVDRERHLFRACVQSCLMGDSVSAVAAALCDARQISLMRSSAKN